MCLWVHLCECVLDLDVEVHSTLSPVRMDGDVPAEMRGGEGSSKGASRWPGRMGAEKMCIRSHCASNVITGSDSSMWHAALPICQSEIGRVTNGYHSYFPQPPPPQPPLQYPYLFQVLREKSDLNLGGSPRVGGPLWL